MPTAIASSPFPDGKPFVIAPLRTISYKKLVNKDPAETAKLQECGEQDGFFYLDLMDDASEDVWSDYESVLATMGQFFDEPLEKKLPFAYGSDTQGYKPIGTQTGATENSRDGFETIRVAMDGLEWIEQPLPPHVLAQKAVFADFINKTRKHVKTLLSSFSDAIDLQGESRFESMHDDNKSSNSSMTFHRYPRRDHRDTNNVGHNKHTDISSIAFLYAQQWGLQVPTKGVPASEDSWDWVQPRAGHAICNIGDSLRYLSNKTLRSVLHRVVPVPEMEHTHRFSIAYFTRPAHGTMFTDSEGRTIACDEYFTHKFDVYRASHAEQRTNTILTGGMENDEQRARVHEGLAF